MLRPVLLRERRRAPQSLQRQLDPRVGVRRRSVLGSGVTAGLLAMEGDGAALLRLLDPLLVEDPLEALGEEGLAERILALVLVGSLGRRVEAFEEAQSLDLCCF